MSKSTDLKKRVIDAKEHLPKMIMPIFLHMWPHYNTFKGTAKVTNVLQLRLANESITKKLEELVGIIKANKCTQK